MRIALLAWEALESTPVSDVAWHISGLARNLAKRGHEVHLFTPLADGKKPDEEVLAVRIHRVPFASHPHFVDQVQFLCRALAERASRAEREAGPFDILHAHDWVTCNAGVWAGETLHRPLVVTFHSIEQARCGFRTLSPEERRIADHEANGARHAARVIVVSHTLRHDAMKAIELPDWRVEVVFNGVEAAAYEGFIDPGKVKARYGAAPIEPLILFVGQLEYRLGADLLVDAAPQILQARPQARLLLAGDGPMRNALEERARRLGVAHAVRFAPLPVGHERIDLFRAADIVVFPARNDPFRMAVLEAWAAGKPVVATQTGGPGEYIWHDVTGVHVQDTPESLAWGVEHLAADPDRARWVGANGRAAVHAAFTWDRAAAHTEEIYRRALAAEE
ncbi:MAG: glycosyltransferase family 4 protein [Planctomycetota bacterium]